MPNDLDLLLDDVIKNLFETRNDCKLNKTRRYPPESALSTGVVVAGCRQAPSKGFEKRR